MALASKYLVVALTVCGLGFWLQSTPGLEYTPVQTTPLQLLETFLLATFPLLGEWGYISKQLYGVVH